MPQWGHPQKSDLDDDIDDMLLCQPSASFDIRRASNNPPSSANQVHPTLPLTKCIQASCQRILMNMAMWCYNIENMDDMDYLPSQRILSNCQIEPPTVQIHSCVTLHNLAQSCTILQKLHNLAKIAQSCTNCTNLHNLAQIMQLSESQIPQQYKRLMCVTNDKGSVIVLDLQQQQPW